MISAALFVLLCFHFTFTQGEVIRIVNDTTLDSRGDPKVIYAPDLLTVQADPPDGAFSPAALGLYIAPNSPTAILFYTVTHNLLDETIPPVPENYPTYDTATRFDGIDFENAYVKAAPTTFVSTNSTPYVHLKTPYGRGRNIVVVVIAVDFDTVRDVWTRSREYVFNYVVEASDRPKSYGFFVPGPETDGHFVSVGLEMKATARAQSAKGQEFADFFSDLGIGTYPTQANSLHLPSLIPGVRLRGYEGGFPMNITNETDSASSQHYGVLVPYHDGKLFHGRVLRVDLLRLRREEDGGNITLCAESVHYEYYNGSDLVVTGPPVDEACVVVLDLGTKHPRARGFRKGFAGYPYAYLSAGEFDINVRLDIRNFTLENAITLDMSAEEPTLGGFSGGFVDGTWACFCPFKEFAGTYGGIRSNSVVDRNTLRVYYASVMVCINQTGWDGVGALSDSIRKIDMGDLDPGLRGYSEAIRVGRYAYLSPLASYTHTYTSKLVRITLGPIDIADYLDKLLASGKRARNMMTVLDLSQKSKELKGFSGLFSAGKFLLMVPYRNSHQPQIGQRGFGTFLRIDMNKFSVAGIDTLDLTTTLRAQIPSFADIDLRCFSGGFSSGFFGYLVPFYNGVFSGKSARLTLYEKDLADNLQELDLVRDRAMPRTFKGFRGGFPSLWQGLPTDSV